MPSREVEPGSRGFIVPIGGAEDQISGRAILRRFTDLCGGTKARIAVLPTASVLPDTGARYSDVFRIVGAGRVTVVPANSREEADADDTVALLDGVTGIFLTGG